jgi:hypothetical protein
MDELAASGVSVENDPEQTIGAEFCRDAQRNTACNDVAPLHAEARHETTRVHHNASWSGGMAACGTRAAGEGLAHRGSRTRPPDARHVERVP